MRVILNMAGECSTLKAIAVLAAQRPIAQPMETMQSAVERTNNGRQTGLRLIRGDRAMLAKGVCLVTGSLFVLQGCVVFPELPPEARVSVVDVLTNIECEIAAALDRSVVAAPFLLQWATAIKVTLNTNNSTGGTTDWKLSTPLVPETLDLSFDFSPDRAHTSSGDFGYSAYLKDLDVCSSYDYRTRKYAGERSAAPVLTGRTGAGDWIARVGAGVLATESCPTSISFESYFQISYSASGSPRISGIEAGDGTFGGGFKLGPKTQQGHKLTVTFAPVKGEPEITNEGYELIQTRLEAKNALKEASRLCVTPPVKAAAPAKVRRPARPAKPSGRRTAREPVGERTQELLDFKENQFQLQQLPSLQRRLLNELN